MGVGLGDGVSDGVGKGKGALVAASLSRAKQCLLLAGRSVHDSLGEATPSAGSPD